MNSWEEAAWIVTDGVLHVWFEPRLVNAFSFGEEHGGVVVLRDPETKDVLGFRILNWRKMVKDHD